MILQNLRSASRGYVLPVLTGLSLTAGCSLSPGQKQGGRLIVNVVPKDPVAATDSFSILSTTPSTLSDINCIGLNIRGGGVSTNAASCGGNIPTGITAGTVASRPASFDVTVPLSNGVTFEAYGFTAAKCVDLGTAISTGISGDLTFNGNIYRLGSTTTDLSTSTTSVTINTSFDSTLGYHCASPPAVANRAVVGGTNFACGVTAFGSVLCWGDNGNGQLGNNSTATNSLVPVLVTGVGNTGTISSITAGNHFTCARDTSSNAYCWGDNGFGQLGNNSTSRTLAPVQVVGQGGTGTLSVSAISAGQTTACAVDSSSNVYCWGANNTGQLGNNSTAMQSTTPVLVLGLGGTGTLTGIKSIAGGAGFSCAAGTAGSAYCWGSGSSGQLGNGASGQVNYPVQVSGLSSVSSISSNPGATHVCAVNTSGNVYCWGNGGQGQLGNNFATSNLTPVQVVGVGGTGVLSSISSVSVGGSHTCAVDTSGKVYCWGANTTNQLGNNSTAGSNAPVQVLGAGGAGTTMAGTSWIGAGGGATCAVGPSNYVYCWGGGTLGALGNNSTSNSGFPVQAYGVGGTGNLQL